jgi:dolichol-phosphate mannosyltransferase
MLGAIGARAAFVSLLGAAGLSLAHVVADDRFFARLSWSGVALLALYFAFVAFFGAAVSRFVSSRPARVVLTLVALAALFFVPIALHEFATCSARGTGIRSASPTSPTRSASCTRRMRSRSRSLPSRPSSSPCYPDDVPDSAALICMPTYNERENLSSLLDEILKTASVDVLIIDDNSPDGTGRVADLIAEHQPRVHVLHRPGKLGLGTAYIAGFRWGMERGYRFLGEMDADFSHQPRYLPELLRAIEEADLVIGSRYVDGGGTENWGLFRRTLSRSASVYARAILHAPVRDFTAGFKLFRREVLDAIDLDTITTTGYAFQIETTYRAFKRGFRIREVPIVFYERVSGRSKMSSAIIAEAVAKVWAIRFQ